MTQKHTPGPWELLRDDKDGRIRICDTDPRRGRLVVEMLRLPDITDHKEELANANLIAAAPDLLAACKHALDALRTTCGRPHRADCSCIACELAQAAIAKAEGREP